MLSRDTNRGALLTKKLGSLERDKEDDSPPTSKRDSRKAREDLKLDSKTKRKHRSSLRRKSRQDSSDSKDEKSYRRKRKSQRRYSSDESSNFGLDLASDSEKGESESSGSDSESDSEGERRKESANQRHRRRGKSKTKGKANQRQRQRRRGGQRGEIVWHISGVESAGEEAVVMKVTVRE
ncbi:NKAP family protein CG6066-like [Arachis ipaensis]|uniref:NKAP family protein CG6066-like n=1 Tax=Arachis ipaensis TaxID=130454 RepID=UPI0007AF74D4|nr:NKAP family protein CG6066-like [Arachis ipaensis]